MTDVEKKPPPEAAINEHPRLNPWMLAVFRVIIALLWIENSQWKRPPEFSSLRSFTEDAVDHPVFPPFSFIVENVVLPNFALFGWLVLITEAALGAFLLVGLFTRFWAIVAIGQTLAIAMSQLNAPDEWEWAYYLMLAAHIGIFATAAGRSYGLDGLLRPLWARQARAGSRLAPWLLRAS